ncbi:MAG: hypothetical protein NC205_08335, partial [Prevotella sp.]|nr:hypothetical protein [Prevotella sp.]
MSEKMNEIKKAFAEKLKSAVNTQALEEIRIEYLGKKGSVTGLMKTMKDLSNEEKKTFGQQVNVLKNEITQAISEKLEQIKQKELEIEINSMPEIDVSAPPVLERGSYHPITLVQRECENVFKSMGFTVEDYSEIVTDYECFES